MSSDRVFLTGASGFIGGHVARELLSAGYRVSALMRDAGQHIPGTETVGGDLRRSGDLVGALRGCRYLVHCAAVYSFAPRAEAEMQRVNVAGTAALLEAARIAGVERTVVTSSSATVGPARDGRPATEEDQALGDLHSPYHRSKILQERAALAARVPSVLVLPTAPIGPADRKPTPTGRLVLDFARGRVFARPPGAGGLNLVAVEDVARAHVLALQRGRARERYLIGAENLRFDQVWEMLADVTGRAAPRWKIPYGMALALGWADGVRCRLSPRAEPVVPLEGVRMARELMHVDCTKAETELGYRPQPVRDALVRALEWYRVHDYLR